MSTGIDYLQWKLVTNKPCFDFRMRTSGPKVNSKGENVKRTAGSKLIMCEVVCLKGHYVLVKNVQAPRCCTMKLMDPVFFNFESQGESSFSEGRETNKIKDVDYHIRCPMVVCL